MMKILTITFLVTLFFSINSGFSQSKKKLDRSKKANKAVTLARSYIKTPYKYGGNTKRGIDCSGLLYNIFKDLDYTLPRTAQQQSKEGKRTNLRRAKKGDLVFFKFKKGGKKWWHTGIVSKVLSDKIYFIHASFSRGVTQSNLMSNYYKRGLKKIKRVI